MRQYLKVTQKVDSDGLKCHEIEFSGNFYYHDGGVEGELATKLENWFSNTLLNFSFIYSDSPIYADYRYTNNDNEKSATIYHSSTPTKESWECLAERFFHIPFEELVTESI